MTEKVRHRGPDGDGYAVFEGADLRPRPFAGRDTPEQCISSAHPFLPGAREFPGASDVRVALGHRRLSIVDLSPGGYQPMATMDRSLWIVYNGEIYNHIELRVELEALGHAFRSHCDTEVLLAAYRAWGPECLHRLNGMFAFVLLDRNGRRVLAARDRFGVKPLYYCTGEDGSIAFASEIKQFAGLDGWHGRLNGSRAQDFLLWGIADHTDETLFAGVKQLRGGEIVEIDLSGDLRANRRRWYTLAPAAEGPRRESVDAFRNLLFDSVRLRLRADVPVGSCLSGGLDSSAIVCVANRLLREHSAQPVQKTFTAVARSPRYDESAYAADVVQRTAVDWHTVHPAAGVLFDHLDKIAWHQDEPFGSTSIYAQWEVFGRAAQNGVRVMLDGQGADELLAGYPAFFGARLAALARALRIVALGQQARALQRIHGVPPRLLARATLAAMLPGWARGIARPAPPSWLNAERLGVRPPHPVDAGPHGSLQALSRAQLLSTSLPMLLHWEDRNSMAHSVEARVPFLDYRLVEFALALPDDLKINCGMTKVVLRESMKEILPERVRIRADKLGFQNPEDEWLKNEPRRFRDALNAAIESSGGIIRPDAARILDGMVTGSTPFSFLAWRLISFGTWMRRFGVKPS